MIPPVLILCLLYSILGFMFGMCSVPCAMQAFHLKAKHVSAVAGAVQSLWGEHRPCAFRL